MKKLPNILTLIRFLLTFIFIFCLTRQGAVFTGLALVLFLLASLTDYYDGYFAKKHNSVSNFGKIMDPIADKFLILAAIFIFVRMGIVAAWVFYVILARELAVTLLRMAVIKKGLFLAAERAGKLKTMSQIAAVFVVLLFLLLRCFPGLSGWMTGETTYWMLGIHWMMVTTVALTVFSGLSYLWNNRKVLASV